jgi:rhodanese-related sulfurtransferase
MHRNPEITWKELLVWREEGHPHLLVDVREDIERELAHIGGQWIPLGELHRHAESLDQGQPVVFYCRKGVRSLIAIQRLLPLCPDLVMYSLRGGMEGLPPDAPVVRES